MGAFHGEGKEIFLFLIVTRVRAQRGVGKMEEKLWHKLRQLAGSDILALESPLPTDVRSHPCSLDANLALMTPNGEAYLTAVKVYSDLALRRNVRQDMRLLTQMSESATGEGMLCKYILGLLFSDDSGQSPVQFDPKRAMQLFMEVATSNNSLGTVVPPKYLSKKRNRGQLSKVHFVKAIVIGSIPNDFAGNLSLLKVELQFFSALVSWLIGVNSIILECTS